MTQLSRSSDSLTVPHILILPRVGGLKFGCSYISMGIILRHFPSDYHWTLMQVEFDIDVMFKWQSDLHPLFSKYPIFIGGPMN